GNAAFKDKHKNDCVNSPNNGDCIENYKFTENEEVSITITGPIIEELICRAIPSILLSIKESSEDVEKEMIYGTGGLKMSKNEVVVGMITSTIFAELHNFTSQGFDVKNIPLPQFIFGSIAWYLQRKFGYFSNLSAHMLQNTIALVMMKSK
ncbi:CPBP family intramembrane metalloprotease, partial [Candidatus Microgenomates bacterium]|nr:CPBP family intramembrane metalloprotease [Candidatus Microgenomates bacterium]